MILLIYILTTLTMSFASVEGFIQELKDLGSPSKGCASNTHNSFRTIEEIKDCSSQTQDNLSELLTLTKVLSVTDLSKAAYLKSKGTYYKNQLGNSYKSIFDLNQLLQGRKQETPALSKQLEDIWKNYNLLLEIQKHQEDEKAILQNLKCDDPRAGDWKARHEICTKLKNQNSSSQLESLKASIYAEHPYLYHPLFENDLQLREHPITVDNFKKLFKKPMDDFSKNISTEISEVNSLLTNDTLLLKMSSPTPGPDSELKPEEWALLSRIVSDTEFKYQKGREKFSYADCLFREDLLNHEKLVGLDLFKKNVALSIVSLGAGAAVARLGTMAKVIATLTPTAAGVAFIDYPEIKKEKLRCDGLQRSLSLSSANSNAWEEKLNEWKSCQTNLKISLLASALGPVSDVVTLANPVLKTLKIQVNPQGFSARKSRVALFHSDPVPQAKIPAVVSEVSIKQKPQKMESFMDFSRQARDSMESPELFAKKYQLSEETAKQIISMRRDADKKIFSRVTDSRYLDEDLTQTGYSKYSSLEEYLEKSKGTIPEGLSTTEVMRQSKHHFSRIRNGEQIFEAMFKAMRNRGEMIDWHSHLYDDLLHRLLSSKNEEWMKSFKKTGKFPRDLVEGALLERASLHGWPSEFTDLSGGILSGKEFGKKISEGKYLRERDLDEVATDIAKKGNISDKQVEEKILKGELKHGELTHAAHMDYMLFLAEKGKLGPLKPQELRGFIKRLGDGLQFNEPGIQNAWSLLFDGTAQGRTLTTPNNFYEVFSQNMEL